NPNNNRIYSGSGDDTIIGGGGNNTIFSGGGDDTVIGGRGSNYLDGGTGDDTFVSGLSDDMIIGGSGTDTIDYSAIIRPINVDMGNLISGYAVVTIDPIGPTFKIDEIKQIENIFSGTGNDTLRGDDNDNVILAGAGDDTVQASGGTDILDGEAGTNTIDFSTIGASVTGVSVILDGSNVATVTVGGGSDQTISNFTNAIGTGGDDMLGGDGVVNCIDGGEGNDTLSGGGGEDTLIGGSGIDTVTYAAVAGGVVVNLSSQIASNDGDGSSDDLLTIENVVGSIFADTIIGDNNSNVIDGRGGVDTLYGLGGADIFIASDGVDVIDGGDDSDTVDYSDLAGATSIAVVLNSSTPVTVTVSGVDNQTISN
ncbi:MAG: calcium-binding protein, partial [Hyphomicrobiaceae bacterium]|nr:calcium-binding protein [Hyphomicrobiaceae bacterium]